MDKEIEKHFVYILKKILAIEKRQSRILKLIKENYEE